MLSSCGTKDELQSPKKVMINVKNGLCWSQIRDNDDMKLSQA